MIAFICGECGRCRTALDLDEPPLAGICLACMVEPGWFRDPELRDAIDPDHPGYEVLDWPLVRGAP